MATYTIDWLPDQKVLMAKLAPEFDVHRDIVEFSAKLVSLLAEADQRVPFIFDMTEFNMTFPDMVSAMADLTRGDIAAWRHENLKELLIVSEQSMMQIGADALQRTQYGKLHSWYFPKLSDALDYLSLIRGNKTSKSESESEPKSES